MGRLRAFVHVTDEVGTSHAFGPDDAVPDWAAAKIVNPRAWAEAPERDVDGGNDDDSEERESRSGTGVADMETTSVLAGVPARKGPGSGRSSWAAYAKANNVQVEDGMSRDDVIAACELAGVATN